MTGVQTCALPICIIATSTVSVTDVSDGTQYNALSYEIYGNGTPVTDNYALTENYGTLKVKACPLSITTAGDEWEYDGAAHPVTSYTAEGLVSGQTLTGLSFYSETAINVSDSGKDYRKTIKGRDGQRYARLQRRIFILQKLHRNLRGRQGRADERVYK